MSLEHPRVPESKKVIKRQKHGGDGRGHPNGKLWTNLNNKMNRELEYYNPNSKINKNKCIGI